MELVKFRENKAAGRVEVKRYGQSFNIVQRRFDPTSGEEVAPSIGTVTREEVQRVRDSAAETLAEANALLAEFDSLEGRQPV